MVEKRPLEDGAAAPVPSLAEAGNGVGDLAKKPKLDAKPSLSLAALEKAKKALQMQKELKEKLKNLPQRTAPPPGQPPAAGQPAAQELMLAATAKAAQIAARFGVSVTPAAPLLAALPVQGAPAVGAGVAVGAPGYKPAPLLLDASGRAVDEHGHVVNKTAAPAPTLRVNQQAASNAVHGGKPGSGSGLPLLAPPPIQELETGEFFDDRMGTAGLKKLNRKSRATFDFVQHGTFLQQAVDFRLRAKYGRDVKPRGPIGPIFAMGDPNQVPLGVNPNLMPLGAGPVNQQEEEVLEPLPAVEWWDKSLLATGSYEADIPDDPAQPIALKDGKITSYIEHPVPLQPPAEGPPPPPQPLKLTTRELKKLRTQRRQAREKEKQDLIRQGLLEPAKPKVKLSNLYRVLGEQAVADPTRLEMETKKQMKERAEAHEDRNLSRALTPAERREKKERKLFDDTGTEVITSVYKILRLDNSHHKYKVDINAKENHMSGVLLITPEFSIVVVEGCRKAIKRYAKLMLRRIDWNEPDTNKLEDEDHMEDEEEEKPPNRCDLVWQGLVRTAAFHGFKVDKCRAEQAVQIMTQRSVLHYWHAATNFVPGESVPVPLE